MSYPLSGIPTKDAQPFQKGRDKKNEGIQIQMQMERTKSNCHVALCRLMIWREAVPPLYPDVIKLQN